MASQVVLVVKIPPVNARDTGDLGLILGLGRSPGVGNGNPLQYSCLESSMDGGAWWAIVHGITKSWTRLKPLRLFLWTRPQSVPKNAWAQAVSPTHCLALDQTCLPDFWWHWEHLQIEMTVQIKYNQIQIELFVMHVVPEWTHSFLKLLFSCSVMSDSLRPHWFLKYRNWSTEELVLLNCGVGEDSWESLGLQGDPTSPS